MVVGGVSESAIVVEYDDFTIAACDPFVVVMVDKHRADVDTAQTAA